MRYWGAGVRVLVYCAAASSPSVLAQSFDSRPVAIVEEASQVNGLQPLQLLKAGQQIDLGENGRLVLGFFASCWQEVITSGRILIETRQSRALGGAMKRRRVECDSTALARSAVGAGSNSAISAPLDNREPHNADLVLFGRNPVILSGSGEARVNIERVDLDDPPIHAEFVNGSIDLNERGIELEPGALYRFSTSDSSILVEVDELAEPGRAPLLGRLVIFRHASISK
jgi:hypothetical protein